jgi:hypothetical protein
MFRLPFLVALALLAAFGLGIGSTVMMLDASSGFGAIRIGAWKAFPAAQTEDADPYARSHRARAGRLLYGAAEGLSFTAETDDAGQKLSPACTYRITGQTPPARFWTVYPSDGKGEPIAVDPALPGALNSVTALRRADGGFTIAVSPRAQSGNWLAAPADRPYRLTLTLFDTPAAGSSGLIDVKMPAIEKAGCP